MKVLKFGGSSVGSIENIHRIINIVRAEKAQDKEVVLVCSAFNKVTDQLINAGKLAEKKDNNTYLEIFQNFKDRHQTTIENIIEDTAIKKEMMDEFFESMDRVEDILKGVHLLGELSDKTLAQLVSYGERFSCFIVAGALRNAGLNGIYVNATQLVRTDSNYLSAKVNFEKTNKNIADFFEAVHGVAVVTGFIGTDEHGNVTTLGRGGSDYTAAIFAAALKASAIEIWTDVDGVLTADPRRVEQAFTIPTLSYKEAMELSHFGAKVIYPPSIQPAYIKNIPLIIKNTFNPEHPGTYISKDSGKSANIIKGISSLSDIALLRMEGTGMVGVVGIASRLFATLSRAGINIIFLTQGSSEHSICFGILPGEIKKAQKSVEEEFRYEIQNRQILPLVIETNNSIIAVIGENMTNSPGVSAKMFKALGKNGINVKAIAQGSSELNITAVIEQVNEAKALNALHEIFFENDVHSVNVFLVGPTGLIGKTLLKQIKNQFDFLQNEKSMQINVTGITNSKKMLIDSNGIDLSDWENELNENGTEANLEAFTRKMVEMNFANTVFVDCSASKHVVEFYEKLLKKSISIVTPNKIANTLSQGVMGEDGEALAPGQELAAEQVGGGGPHAHGQTLAPGVGAQPGTVVRHRDGGEHADVEAGGGGAAHGATQRRTSGGRPSPARRRSPWAPRRARRPSHLRQLSSAAAAAATSAASRAGGAAPVSPASRSAVAPAVRRPKAAGQRRAAATSPQVAPTTGRTAATMRAARRTCAAATAQATATSGPAPASQSATASTNSVRSEARSSRPTRPAAVTTGPASDMIPMAGMARASGVSTGAAASQAGP